MSSFITTYSNDYKPHIIKLERRKNDIQEKSPIIVPFYSHLKLDSDQLKNETEEYGTTFLETKVKPNKGIEKNHFQNPIDQEEIRNYLKAHLYTTYTADYSNGCKVLSRKNELHKDFNVDKNFKLQSTTYSKAFREPNVINNNVYKRKLGTAPDSNLTLNPKILSLLSGKYNISEYGDIISSLGGDIIKDQMYGKIKH